MSTFEAMSVLESPPLEAAALSRRLFIKRAALHCAGVAFGGSLGEVAFANPRPLQRPPGEVVISRLPGIMYLPSYVMEKDRLIEKHAARLGFPGLSVRWVNVNTGTSQREALLFGNADIIMSGLVPLLRLWDLTDGAVKGIVAGGGLPLSLVSVDPRIGSLRDINRDDRIAVPVLQYSTQAVLLQMASSQLHGVGAWSAFDRNCVAMPHSAAFALLRNRSSAIRLHFSVPPYCFYERRRLRDARVVATSTEITGGVHSNTHFYTTSRFAEANPLVLDALRAAAVDAGGLIAKNTQEAVASYRAFSGDKTEAADILEALAEPGMMDWHIEPTGTLAFAQHLHRIGGIKRRATSWRDYYFETSHGFAGS